jgi:fibronectin-binding autotransporter adhesin
VVKAGTGTLNIASSQRFTGPLILSNGVVSVGSLANGGTASPIGAGSAFSYNLLFDGGLLRYTGATASINRMFEVGSGGGGLEVTRSDATLTVDGGGWQMSGPFVVRGPGTLRLTNYRYSYATGSPEVLVDGGTLNLDTSYSFQGGVFYNGGIRIHLTNEATLIQNQNLALAENGGSLDQIIVERGSTWNSSSASHWQGIGSGTYSGEGRIILRGGRITGGFRIISGGALTLWTRASDTSAYCAANFNPRPGGQTMTIDVEDGVADEDFIQDSPIYGNITTLNKTGQGKWVFADTHSGNGLTLNISGGMLQVGDDAYGAGTLNGGTAGTVNNAAILAFVHSATNSENDNIAGTGSVVQAGTGRIDLYGANTYSGPTFVSNGTLRVMATHSGSGAYAVRNGATLGGTGTLSAATITADNGSYVGNSDAALTASMTVNGLNALNGATLWSQIRTAYTGIVVTANNAFTTASGGTNQVRFVAPSGWAVGTYPVVDYVGTIQGGGIASLIPRLPSGVQGYLTNVAAATRVDLVVTNVSLFGLKWYGSTDNNWDVDTTANWRDIANADVTFSLNDSVLLDESALAARYTVTVAQAIAPSSVIVSNTTRATP